MIREILISIWALYNTLNSNPILLTEIEILAEIIWINNSVYNIDTLNLLVLKYIIIIIDIPIIKYL